MACERNRIIELKKYLNSLGIDTNISKTNARGHNGIFIHKTDGFRIDISKKVDNEKVMPVLLHEFAHYVHYLYDKNLQSLDFVFGSLTEDIREELIKVTVHNVPKEFAASLYGKKAEINSDIKELVKNIKKSYADFKLSENCKEIEKHFSNPVKYLLKYDRIKYFNRIYSISNLNSDFDLTDTQIDYIKLKSKQRYLRRINAKINRLNKYYNNPTELFARFIELYYTNPDETKRLAPIAFARMQNASIKEFDMLNKIFN